MAKEERGKAIGMEYPKASVIIVNWNGKRYLKDCLPSVSSQTYPNYEVIMVDNGSSDGSIEYVQDMFPQVKVICLDKNYGFSQANNIGIEQAFQDPKVKYIVTLNNDTEVDTHWLKELVMVAEEEPAIGSCASKMIFYNNRELIDAAGIIFRKDYVALNRGHKKRDSGQYERLEEVFGACAGAALYRRETLKDVGLFDERFFAYFEDVDLAIRCRLAGYKCMYVPTAIVYHIHSATGGSGSPMQVYLTTRNRIWYVLKNPFPQPFLFRLCIVISYNFMSMFLNIALASLRKRQPKCIPASIKGQIDGLLGIWKLKE